MQILGRLGDQPELVNSATGREIVKYVVATSWGPNSDRKTSWFRVVSFEEPSARRDFMLTLPKG
jgi:hypothetical protein